MLELRSHRGEGGTQSLLLHFGQAQYEVLDTQVAVAEFGAALRGDLEHAFAFGGQSGEAHAGTLMVVSEA